jgi:hypothetical protein
VLFYHFNSFCIPVLYAVFPDYSLKSKSNLKSFTGHHRSLFTPTLYFEYSLKHLSNNKFFTLKFEFSGNL